MKKSITINPSKVISIERNTDTKKVNQEVFDRLEEYFSLSGNTQNSGYEVVRKKYIRVLNEKNIPIDVMDDLFSRYKSELYTSGSTISEKTVVESIVELFPQLEETHEIDIYTVTYDGGKTSEYSSEEYDIEEIEYIFNTMGKPILLTNKHD